MDLSRNDIKIAVIGLGYVGLPLAVEFGKQYQVTGFDISEERVEELRGGFDRTREVDRGELGTADGLTFTSEFEDLAACNVYIVTVPTPIDSHKRPNLALLLHASEAIGKVVSNGDLVIYESTVYPGATEEDCVPVIERVSGLKFNVDFFAGYSPERMNPGDKEHSITTIIKVTSGSTPEIADFVDTLYASIVSAGTFKATSIRVAEAAKVIENTQRDLNIALVNELAIIFNRLGLDTREILEAAGTKWNFLPFWPGLVGGHCIGVDPYYLTHKAQETGYQPEVILAGRRINDGMGKYVGDEVIKLMLRKNIAVLKSRILVLGLAFKENCADLRNTRVVDIINTLSDYNTLVDVYDPWIDSGEARQKYGLDCLTQAPATGQYDTIVLAVGHRGFVDMGEAGIRAFGKPNAIVYDVRGVLPLHVVDGRL